MPNTRPGEEKESEMTQIETTQHRTLKMPRPAPMGATRWQVWRGRIRMWIGATLCRIWPVGLVRSFKIDDAVTGQHIEIRVGALFTIIAVNGRDYYFRRFTGKFDGTGMAIGCGMSQQT